MSRDEAKLKYLKDVLHKAVEMCAMLMEGIPTIKAEIDKLEAKINKPKRRAK